MSPTAIDKLDKSSSDAQKKAAVSDCIAMEMDGGMKQDQAIAACMSMMRKKTGMMEPGKEGS